MRRLRQRLRQSAAYLGAAGLLGLAWWLRQPDAPARLAAVEKLTGLPVSAERVVFFESNADDASTVAAQDAHAASRPAARLSAMESTQFTTLCDLHLLAADADLDLTTKQWSAFAAAVVQAQAVRHNYEAQIAVVHETAPGRYRVEIPAYAAAGDELRRQFLADLQSALGAEASAEVLAKLGRKLEGRFAGFGVGTQTLEIAGDPAQAPDRVQIARTAQYWNSVEGSERTTTRREMLYPADEDPSGERWSALLARVSKSD